MIYQLETLDSLIDYNKQLAEKWFKEKGSLTPMIIGYTRDNKQKIVIVGQFQDEEEKLQWLNMASATFFLFDIDKYTVMVEGWMVKDPTIDIGEIYKKYGSLENYPDRAECLNLIAVNRHGAKMSTSEILPDKTLKSLGTDSYAVTGRMCELLPNNPSPLSPKERDRLFELLKKQGISLEDL